MIPAIKYIYLCIIYALCNIESCTCTSESRLSLYSPGEVEYTDVLVRRVGDNLTLVCEQRGDSAPRLYVWNYVADNGTSGEASSPVISPVGASVSSSLWKGPLAEADSGHYMCSAPPHSVSKYILVQRPGRITCARGAFVCGARCVLGAYVCDGWRDCVHGEDESPALCGAQACGAGRLRCSSGRCIPISACCDTTHALCRQPACCLEHTLHADSLADDFPPLYEDKHADDYGFIQSTIYTVTACALIFMIAVVLLVSAICKMHMKRAALRGYTLAHQQHIPQPPRFPPCYEEGPPSPRAGPLSRLSSIFSTRYRQVPTVSREMELSSVSQLTYSLNGRTITLGAPLDGPVLPPPPSYSEALRHKPSPSPLPPRYSALPPSHPHLDPLIPPTPSPPSPSLHTTALAALNPPLALPHIDADVDSSD